MEHHGSSNSIGIKEYDGTRTWVDTCVSLGSSKAAPGKCNCVGTADGAAILFTPGGSEISWQVLLEGGRYHRVGILIACSAKFMESFWIPFAGN